MAKRVKQPTNKELMEEVQRLRTELQVMRHEIQRLLMPMMQEPHRPCEPYTTPNPPVPWPTPFWCMGGNNGAR